MTTLRTAAQQALEALEWHYRQGHSNTLGGLRLKIDEKALRNLKAALAEHDKNLAWFKDRKANWDLQRKLAEETQERDRQQALVEDALQRFTDVNQELEAALAEPAQEPPCATRECMPSECPNCASLEAQNTELDRKLADLEQEPVAWSHINGTSDTKWHPPQRNPEPVQEPVAWQDTAKPTELHWEDIDPIWHWMYRPLYAAPPQRKPLTEEQIETAYIEIWRTLSSDFDHTSSGWIEMGIRYAEQAHGIK